MLRRKTCGHIAEAQTSGTAALVGKKQATSQYDHKSHSCTPQQNRARDETGPYAGRKKTEKKSA